MKTACHKTYTGPGRVSISIGNRGLAAGFRIYKPLAPSWEMLKRGYNQEEFVAILAGLDAKKAWDDIHRLAGDAEPILLCWEKPPFTAANWCHRRLVAIWLEQQLGVQVPELGFEPAPVLV